ncbi:MAG TPA: hypothetical protein VII31_11425 [Caldimonas sp.]
MKTSIPSLALAAALASVTALATAPAAAASHGFGGSGHGFVGASHGGSGWHGGAMRGRGGFFRGGRGNRGFWPGAFWGGIGLGVGIGAISYYDGYYAPYPYSDGYYYDAPEVIVSPGYPAVDPAAGMRSGQPVPQASRAAEPIFYPKNGQSMATTESDRRECNRWATTQPGAMADASIFQRATFACMEGRGYSAR